MIEDIVDFLSNLNQIVAVLVAVVVLYWLVSPLLRLFH